MKNEFTIDFVGVGAEKAATTWLADCLREHPEIYVPKQKELFFFNEYDPHFLEVKNYKYSQGISWYERQFEDGGGAKLKGEISPTYLYGKGTAKRIKKYFPNTKVLIILRDPTKRAFSQYVHDQRLGLIKGIGFDEALKKYKSYKLKSAYYNNVKNYIDIFSRKSVLVLILDEITKNSEKEIKKVYKFLGVKDINYTPPSLYKKPNRAGKARFFWLNHFMINTEYFLRRNNLLGLHKALELSGIRNLALAIRDINSSRGNSYPKLDKSIEVSLKKTFREDIEKVEGLLGKNLSEWK